MAVPRAWPTSKSFDSLEPHPVESGASSGWNSSTSQGSRSLTGESFPRCDFLPLPFCVSKRSLAPSSRCPPIRSYRQLLPALILKLNEPDFPRLCTSGPPVPAGWEPSLGSRYRTLDLPTSLRAADGQHRLKKQKIRCHNTKVVSLKVSVELLL